MSAQGQFLTQTNYTKVVTFLQQHYASKMSVKTLPERLDSRIRKTVQHYMMEISRVRGTAPLNVLNQEVLRETTVSMDDWIRKQDEGKRPAPLPQPVQTKPKPTESAFSDPFLTPEFRSNYSMDEEEDPIVLMNRIKKQREEEAKSLQGSTEPALQVQELEDVRPQAQVAPPRLAPLPQDYIIPQENIVKYKETEYNIFLTSSDRDWMRNKTENRYSFSVLFNPGTRQGYGLSPSVQERFRNIQRIEFVKILMPTESLTTLVRTTAKIPTVVTNYDRIVNVFSLPFIGVRIAELNNNGFSTNPREDNTFAIVQYDSTWSSDESLSTTNPSKNPVGYTGFIPKHLKCQRIYEPTPLTNLQKMTIRVERHDGELLTADPDVFSIARICLSSTTTGIAITNNSVYGLPGNDYIFVETGTWFPFSAISEGDMINVQGYTVATGALAEATRVDFEQFINVPGGLYVVATAYTNTTTGSIEDGANTVGYSNILILRSRFDNPSTGSVARQYFGGSLAEEAALAAQISAQPPTTAAAAFINLSRQTHLVLRVITREMDATSNIRPDNV